MRKCRPWYTYYLSIMGCFCFRFWRYLALECGRCSKSRRVGAVVGWCRKNFGLKIKEGYEVLGGAVQYIILL